MIINRLVKTAVQAALAQGVVFDLKTNYKDPKKEEFRYGTSIQDGDKVTLEVAQVEAVDKYKVPFFLVTGILIGAAFGLKHAKVVVIK